MSAEREAAIVTAAEAFGEWFTVEGEGDGATLTLLGDPPPPDDDGTLRLGSDTRHGLSTAPPE